jgi:hypothetical protein
MKATPAASVPSLRRESVERFLSIHHQLQDELFAELGVRIIWVEDFAEIPVLVRSIASSAA